MIATVIMSSISVKPDWLRCLVDSDSNEKVMIVCMGSRRVVSGPAHFQHGNVAIVGADPAGFACTVKRILVKADLDPGRRERRLNTSLPVRYIPGCRIFDGWTPRCKAVDGRRGDGGAGQRCVENVGIVC